MNLSFIVYVFHLSHVIVMLVVVLRFCGSGFGSEVFSIWVFVVLVRSGLVLCSFLYGVSTYIWCLL